MFFTSIIKHIKKFYFRYIKKSIHKCIDFIIDFLYGFFRW